MKKKSFKLGAAPGIRDFAEVAYNFRKVSVPARVVKLVAARRRGLAALLEGENAMYGINTGFGELASQRVSAENLKTLTEFYPRHIEKEDKLFFPSSRSYFTDEEDQAMLTAFWEFDRKMIHEKYKSMIEVLEKKQ